jgi:hypothetical protein
MRPFQLSRPILSWANTVWKAHKRFARIFLTAETSQVIFCSLKCWFSLQGRQPGELNLVSTEPPGNEDSEYVFKIVLAHTVCEWNSNTKCLATQLSTSWGGGAKCDKLAYRGSGNSSTLEFDENDGFLTASLGPCMGHTLRLFLYTFHLKKDTKESFWKKMPEVRIELDKMLQD